MLPWDPANASYRRNARQDEVVGEDRVTVVDAVAVGVLVARNAADDDRVWIDVGTL